MEHPQFSMMTTMRKLWAHFGGARYLLTTFWPRDYRRGKTYQIRGRSYRITYYFHAPDTRFYEVWGYALPANAPRPSYQRFSSSIH